MKKKLLPTLFFLLTISTLFAQVNITFEVSTATITDVSPDGIYLAGGSGFGVPGDNPMTDPDGDGVWTVTVQRDMGFSSHYTFLNGNCPGWDCKENLAGLPCGDPANFNDRLLLPVMSDTTIQACFGTCDDLSSCMAVTDSVNITFELNTATIAVDPGGIFIAGGGNFGNPGDNQMMDPDGDGIYIYTTRRPMGFVSFYTFANGNCPDYSCKENLAGLPCGDPNNFNDRFLGPVMSDMTVQACFGTCDDDGSCTIVTDSIDITFELNTSTITVDAGGIFIAGGGNFGNPGDNPMVDPDGDGIYTFTTRRAAGFASFYIFTNGNCPDFTCKENLEGLPCGNPDNFNDRFFTASQDTTIQACFGACDTDGTCNSVSVYGLEIDETLFILRPTLVNDYTTITFGEKAISEEKQVYVYNAVGQTVYNSTIQNTASYDLNTSKYSNGLYFVSVRTEDAILTKKFVVRK